jgi:hypothetical protein
MLIAELGKHCVATKFVPRIDFVAQFTTDIRHISGQDNDVADAFCRVESITAPQSNDALATSQDGDDELQTLLRSTAALRLDKLPIPGTTVSIYCFDVSSSPPVRDVSLYPFSLCTLGDLDRTFQLP